MFLGLQWRIIETVNQQWEVQIMSQSDEKPKPSAKDVKNSEVEKGPGSGIRQLKTTAAFRTFNFELYVKPVSDHN